jgi:hypothetical protein
MITGGSCPHPLYRITGVSPHRRAATADFAEALGGRHSVSRGRPISWAGPARSSHACLEPWESKRHSPR